MALKQRFEDGRLLYQLLKSPHRWIRLLAPDQKVDSANLRQVHQGIDQPHLPDEPRHADQHDLLAGQRLANRKWPWVAAPAKIHNGPLEHWDSACSWNLRRLQSFLAGEVQIADQPFRVPPSVRPDASDSCEQSPRPNDRLQQPPGRDAVAKLQPIRNQPLYPEMLRQRPHHMVQALTDKHDARPGIHQRINLPNSIRLEIRL